MWGDEVAPEKKQREAMLLEIEAVREAGRFSPDKRSGDKVRASDGKSESERGRRSGSSAGRETSPELKLDALTATRSKEVIV